MAKKPQLPQPQTPTLIQERDKFETPYWATDIIFYYSQHVTLDGGTDLWEPCAGTGRIAKRLRYLTGLSAHCTDLADNPLWDVLTYVPGFHWDVAITNPPFSIWHKVWKRLLTFKKPFAILVPSAPTGRFLSCVFDDGGQVIYPSKRIPFITPNLIELTYQKTTLWEVNKATGKKFKNYQKIPLRYRLEHPGQRFDRVDDIPNELIQKVSAPQMETAWLTWGWTLRDQFQRYQVPSGVLEYV